MVIVDSSRLIVGGVDTHRDVNVAAVVDMNGGLLGVESFPTTADGHRCLSSWSYYENSRTEPSHRCTSVGMFRRGPPKGWRYRQHWHQS